MVALKSPARAGEDICSLCFLPSCLYTLKGWKSPTRSLIDLLICHCPYALQMTFITGISFDPHVSNFSPIFQVKKFEPKMLMTLSKVLNSQEQKPKWKPSTAPQIR